MSSMQYSNMYGARLSIAYSKVCFPPQHWSNISTSIGLSVEWPLGRSHHAATHLFGPLFVIIGGLDEYGCILYDMWLCDTTTKLWKKVLFIVSFVCTNN